VYLYVMKAVRNNSEKWELTFKTTGDNLTKDEKKEREGYKNDYIQ